MRKEYERQFMSLSGKAKDTSKQWVTRSGAVTGDARRREQDRRRRMHRPR